MDNKRHFPRSNVHISIDFDFVKWNERRVNRCKKKFKTIAYNISAQGVGLIDLPDITEGQLKQLYSGIKKLRLTFVLNPEHEAVNTFARLVWNNHGAKEVTDDSQCGFEFIDIPSDSFNEINSFVENNMKT